MPGRDGCHTRRSGDICIFCQFINFVGNSDWIPSREGRVRRPAVTDTPTHRWVLRKLRVVARVENTSIRFGVHFYQRPIYCIITWSHLCPVHSYNGWNRGDTARIFNLFWDAQYLRTGGHLVISFRSTFCSYVWMACLTASQWSLTP